MFIYQRTAQYHETDQMGFIHHANYIKWMEESRIAFLQSIGVQYRHLEEQGLISPVTDIHVSYKNPVRFSDTVLIGIRIRSYSGVRLELSYELRSSDGTLHASADSTHCFLENGRVVSLRKRNPSLDALILKQAEKDILSAQNP